MIQRIWNVEVLLKDAATPLKDAAAAEKFYQRTAPGLKAMMFIILFPFCLLAIFMLNINMRVINFPYTFTPYVTDRISVQALSKVVYFFGEFSG